MLRTSDTDLSATKALRHEGKLDRITGFFKPRKGTKTRINLTTDSFDDAQDG